jgi:peptidase M23-like protein
MKLRSAWILAPVFLGLGVAFAGRGRGEDLALAVLPEPAYLERAAAGWLANWDLLLTNSGERSWTLVRLQVSVLDGTGALEWQKFVDGNGVSPSLLTIPVRVVGPEARLLVLNPLYAFPVDLSLARIVFELDLESGAEARTLTAEVVPVRYENQAELRLPLAGRFLVWDGHDFLAHHRRWDHTFEPIAELGFDGNAGRYSYDFLPLDAEGARSHGDEADNASWVGFGQPILAPAAGKVVAVVDDRPDDRTLDMAALAADLRNVYGNYVVVDHGHGEHSVFGHIRQKSATVKVGDAVVPGQVLAAIGASGSSLMPHLHYQLQDDASAHAEGLPSYFHGYTLVRGARNARVAFGQVDSGDLLEGDPPGTGR